MRVFKRNLVMSILLVVILVILVVVPVAAQGVMPQEVVPGAVVDPGLNFKVIMGTLAVIGMLAFMVETLVEALIGRPLEHFPKLIPYKWLLVYVAVIFGVIGAFIYRFDVLYLLGLFVEVSIPKTGFGITITGVSIGMGAAYFHQIVSKFFASNNGAQG